MSEKRFLCCFVLFFVLRTQEQWCHHLLKVDLLGVINEKIGILFSDKSHMDEDLIRQVTGISVTF